MAFLHFTMQIVRSSFAIIFDPYSVVSPLKSMPFLFGKYPRFTYNLKAFM